MFAWLLCLSGHYHAGDVLAENLSAQQQFAKKASEFKDI